MIINLGHSYDCRDSPIPDSYYIVLDLPLKIATYAVLLFNHHHYTKISSIIDILHECGEADLYIDILRGTTYANLSRSYKMYK